MIIGALRGLNQNRAAINLSWSSEQYSYFSTRCVLKCALVVKVVIISAIGLNGGRCWRLGWCGRWVLLGWEVVSELVHQRGLALVKGVDVRGAGHVVRGGRHFAFERPSLSIKVDTCNRQMKSGASKGVVKVPIFELQKQVHYQRMHNQGLRQLRD